MTYLFQQPVSITNTDTLTVSTLFNFATQPDKSGLTKSVLLEWFLPSHAVFNAIWIGGIGSENTLRVALAGQSSSPTNAVFIGLLQPFVPNSWNHLFFSCKMNSLLFNVWLNGTDVLTPQLPDALIVGDPGADYTMGINGGRIAIPNYIPASIEPSHPEIRYGCTQTWWGKYVDPTPENLAKFYRIEDTTLYPFGGTAAVAAFGAPDIWFERDNVSGVEFEENLGTAGDFEVVGTPPEDYTPGPEQGIPLD